MKKDKSDNLESTASIQARLSTLAKKLSLKGGTADKPIDKESVRAMHGLPANLKIKVLDQYEILQGEKKTKGTNKGAWRRKAGRKIFKGPKWMMKTGAGYVNYGSKADQKLVSEIYAIREAYAGELYKVFLPRNSPETQLAVRDTLDTGDETKFGVASKKIKGFKEIDAETKTHPSYTDISDYGKDVTKAIIVAMILGETDLKNEGNIGLSRFGNLVKIDHGESLNLGEDGSQFKLAIDFSPEHLAKISGFSTKYFTPENIKNSLEEITRVDMKRVTEVSDKYEPLLDRYRSDELKYMTGIKPGQIADNVSKRIALAHEYLKTLDASEDIRSESRARHGI